jgi:hypothetical protein
MKVELENDESRNLYIKYIQYKIYYLNSILYYK